ncbi:uncharacterized protein BCR38DRAFT_148535 [Pseudomassariella vexata]|uniref:Uncharacterized protein n=1 Tax=Pseudomassariella vexata TaxID=1141098 RepID=A0A1Y2D4Y0_9PEZI|nr:uncharacterized protein BCR38DRAFT_148535 [Pseudomassariella vexata]ORY54358.1 hypothetical protein BCR38DRAFT_148535 [Pseudomassariella vexata]
MDVCNIWLTEPDYNPRLMDAAQTPLRSAEEIVERLVDLNIPTVWGFCDEAGTFTPFQTLGVTGSMRAPNTRGDPTMSWITSMIHVGHLRALCDEQTPLAERCNIQASLAVVMLHEIMHATYRSRVSREPDIPGGEEPYMYPEVNNEIGDSFETAIFGGLIRPNPTARGEEIFRGVNTHLSVLEWPHFLDLGNLPAATIAHVASTQVSMDYLIPVAWASALQTQHFWDAVVPVHGSAAFKAPRILRNELVKRDWYIGYRIHSSRRMQIENSPPEMQEYYKQALINWQNRKQYWELIRP